MLDRVCRAFYEFLAQLLRRDVKAFARRLDQALGTEDEERIVQRIPGGTCRRGHRDAQHPLNGHP